MKNEESTKNNRTRAEMLSEALGEVNGAYVTEAEPGDFGSQSRTETVKAPDSKNTVNPKETKKVSRWIPVLLFAAGFLLVAGLGIGALLHLGLLPFKKSPSGGKEGEQLANCWVSSEEDNSEEGNSEKEKGPVNEKEHSVSYLAGEEVICELPDTARETEEQYWFLYYSWDKYRSRCKLVSEGLLTESLGIGTISDNEKEAESEVRKIGNIDPEILVAAKLPEDAGWCVYLRDDLWEVMDLDADEPDDTLGDLMERADLEHLLKLRTFYVKDESECRVLEDGCAERILQILKDAQNSPRIGMVAFERNPATFEQKRLISFSITSEELGIRNRAFTLREGGFLETNLLEYGFYYDLGEDTVNAIFSEAMEHSTVVTEDPDGIHYLAGRIVKAEADELVLDDTDLCLEGVEGWEYHFSGDLGKKYEWLVSNGDLKVGDLVCVSFYGPKEQNEDGTWLIRERIEDITEAFFTSAGGVTVKE